jgi:hypothetical protein
MFTRRSPRATLRNIPVTIAAFNDAMVDSLTGPLRPFVHSGDEVDLVSGNHDRPLSVERLNAWVSRLGQLLPPGVRFSAHSSGLENIAAIVQQASPSIRSILLDYEPNWDPQFTWDFPATVAHFQQFARVCRSGVRRAVAYPTGRPLREIHLQQFAWDYGELYRHVDDVYLQTQHWSTMDSKAWLATLDRLRAQRERSGVTSVPLTVQLTIGDRENGLMAAPALVRYQEAQARGLGRLYLWWAPGLASEVARFLFGIER